jgi:DNA-binding response OmpR family regulator
MDSNPPPPAATHQDAPSVRRRVLLADDDDDIRNVFELVLSEHFDVACARSGSEALALARDMRPHVILVDWTLPDTSGGELVGRLRASGPELADIAVVVVSGAPSLKALAEGIGAVPCSKPCDVDQLLAAIERALSARSH